MSWIPCPDPPHRQACGWELDDSGVCAVAGQGNPLRVRTVPFSRLGELGESDWDVLEILADEAAPPLVGIGHPFVLRWPGERADLGGLQLWLEWAQAHDCLRVLCESPLGDQAYHYRWLTLARSLCDEHRLPFAVLERAETPEDWRLNRFLATRKRCCRGG